MEKGDTTKRLEEAFSEVNPDERDALREMWDAASEAEEQPNISSESVGVLWQKLAEAASIQEVTLAGAGLKGDRDAMPSKLRKTHTRRNVRLWAGVLTMLVIGIAGLVLWIQPITQTAPYGQRLSVHLPDGSSLELNSGSSVILFTLL